jgi:lipopolysaccharide export LptBFGC system permease protein LptF
MRIKKTIILIVLLLIALSAALYFSKMPVQSPTTENENQVVGNINTYTNASTGQTLKVSYDKTNNTATLYPDENNKIVFTASTTNSGIVYVNSEQGLILSNEDNGVSLYLNDSLIFTGDITDNNVDENTTSDIESPISDADENIEESSVSDIENSNSPIDDNTTLNIEDATDTEETTSSTEDNL